MAGSLGTELGLGSFAGCCSIRRSFTSLPRKMMYSYTWSEGPISSSGFDFLPSVPKDLTFSRETVDCSELI